jgi:hypothetical protein
MAGHKSPLRDRLLSNSPDPIKSSILRESGMGWNSPPSIQGSISSGSSGSITSPLRIAKRDSPARALPQRRSSSSYKHVRNNNLVSKSPFKSQIPTPLSTPSRHTPITFPSPRNVSGEKRPRPSSMHEQAENENERPFSLKRERRQSKGFQGLIQKEPVTKSPFKQRTPSAEEQPPLPPLPVPRVSIPSFVSTPKPSSLNSTVPSPAPATASPARSSLVSRRMHGPRISGSGRRERRKTVTFDERCDVVEFDKDEETDEDMYSAEEGEELHEPHSEYESHQDDDPFYQGQSLEQEDMPVHESSYEREEDSSYESIQLSDVGADSQSGPSLLSMALDPDASISGLVDEMFFSGTNNAASPTPPLQCPDETTAHTLPGTSLSNDIPTDMEATDGVAFERPALAERFLYHQHRQSQSPHSPHLSPEQRPIHASNPQSPPHPMSHQSVISDGYPLTFNLPTHASPQGPPATPPRRLPVPSPAETNARQLATISENSGRSPEAVNTPPYSQQSIPPVAFNAGHRVTPPLGRSTHIERVLRARSEENSINVDMLPGTPSPNKGARRSGTGVGPSESEGWIPRFGLDTGAGRLPLSCILYKYLIFLPADVAPHQPDTTPTDDPFAIHKASPSTLYEGDSNDSLDPANLSIGGSEVGVNSLVIEVCLSCIFF